jgi:ribonuclease P protein component
MIPKSRKFPLRTEFLAFRRAAKRLSSPHLTIYYLESDSPSRLAVIIPKKVNKLAVVRNWLKRLTFDSVWPLVKDKSLDLVVVYKPINLAKSSDTKKQIIHEISQSLNLR